VISRQVPRNYSFPLAAVVARAVLFTMSMKLSRILSTVAVLSITAACAVSGEEEEDTGQSEDAVKKADRHCRSRERSDAEEDAAQRKMKGSGDRGGRIQVYVHVITTSEGAGDVSDERIRSQVDVLERSFRGTGFDFQLTKVDRIANDEWATQTEKFEAAMKRKLHRGNKSDLNVYIAAGFDYLGWSYLPEDLGKDSKLDGIVIQPTSLPGGAAPFDLGLTAVHEVGHWLGLEHTFKGGCNGKNGDFIDDTPNEKGPAEGCPVGRNTCTGKGDKGKDPIHNFMDYSDDRCLTDFTNDQGRRMRRMWNAYRVQ
jgi:hypothetical protein